MSYAMPGLSGPSGRNEADCADFSSGGADHCIGYERSCPDSDKCCPTLSWFNWVYRHVKGETTARAESEKKVRAGGLILTQTDLGGKTAMERYAAANGYRIAGITVEAIRAAYSSFDRCFPQERFRYVEHLKDSLYGCGAYDGWREDPKYWPAGRFDAIQSASKITLASQFRSAVREQGLSPQLRTGDLDAWLTAARNLVFGAPGAQRQQYVDTPPLIQHLLQPDGAGNLEPTQWLADFIQFFLPKQAGAGREAGRAPTTGRWGVTDPSWGGAQQHRWEVIPSEPRTEPPTGSAGSSTALMIGVGAAALGLGVVVARRVFQ